MKVKCSSKDQTLIACCELESHSAVMGYFACDSKCTCLFTFTNMLIMSGVSCKRTDAANTCYGIDKYLYEKKAFSAYLQKLQ